MDFDQRKIQDNRLIDLALKFLVEKICEHCHNKKPLLSHSVRVAFRLDALGYDKNIVIAALLHDLLEDTNTTSEEIAEIFGKKIANFVKLMTFDSKVEDKIERYKINFEAMKKNKSVLIVRAADLIENSFYYDKALDKKSYQYLLNKYSYFLLISKTKIHKEAIYRDLIYRFKILKKHEDLLYK